MFIFIQIIFLADSLHSITIQSKLSDHDNTLENLMKQMIKEISAVCILKLFLKFSYAKCNSSKKFSFNYTGFALESSKVYRYYSQNVYQGNSNRVKSSDSTMIS